MAFHALGRFASPAVSFFDIYTVINGHMGVEIPPIQMADLKQTQLARVRAIIKRVLMQERQEGSQYGFYVGKALDKRDDRNEVIPIDSIIEQHFVIKATEDKPGFVVNDLEFLERKNGKCYMVIPKNTQDNELDFVITRLTAYALHDSYLRAEVAKTLLSLIPLGALTAFGGVSSFVGFMGCRMMIRELVQFIVDVKADNYAARYCTQEQIASGQAHLLGLKKFNTTPVWARVQNCFLDLRKDYLQRVSSNRALVF